MVLITSDMSADLTRMTGDQDEIALDPACHFVCSLGRRLPLHQHDLQDKVCVSEFDDPSVPGVACYISQARKGGWGQPFGLNEDPSNFSVSCRQVGPITVDLAKLPNKEEAFSEKTSIFFKRTRIYRLPDAKRHVIAYVAVSSKIINGSPANSVDVVPIKPWPQAP